MDRDPNEFDLKLDWGSLPPNPGLPTPVHQAEDEHDAGPPPGPERMRLVLALGESEVGLRGAIDAIDARAASLTGAPPLAALEEVREYIAAAFDAVRELTSQLVVLTDRLELAPGRLPSRGMWESIEAQHEEIPAPEPKDDTDLRLTEELVEEFGVVAGRIERAMERVEVQQGELRAEFSRLVDELAAYRRRVQVHARPPIVTEEQLQSLVAGVAAAMEPPTARKMPGPAPEAAPEAAGSPPTDEAETGGRRRRRRSQRPSA